MKKFFYSFALVAAAAMTLISCNKEVENPVQEDSKATHTVKFTASIATKTAMTEGTESASFAWNTTDADLITIYEDGVASTDVDANLEDGFMSLYALFDGDESGDHTYVATLNGAVPAEQELVPDGKYDEKSDVLVSKMVEVKASDIEAKDGTKETSVSLQFKRVIALNKVTFSGFGDTDSKINSVVISSENAQLAGIYDVNAETPDWITADANEITLTPAENATFAISNQTAVVYFNCIPTDAAKITFTVTTDKGTYSRTAKSLSLKENELNTYTIPLKPLSEITHTIEWSSTDDWESDSDAGTLSLKSNDYGYSVFAIKNNGTTAPTINAKANDCRVYAKGDITVSNEKLITKLVFNISTQGLTRLASISASTGQIKVQSSGDTSVEWTGLANSITFTVGDDAVYGSDGPSKAGQLDFDSIDATYLSTETPSDPTKYSVTISEDIVGGTVTANPMTAEAGTTVTLTPEAATGYEFTSWDVTNASTSASIEVSEDNKFTMPAADVNVSATFTQVSESEDEETASFIFNTDAGLSALKIAKPSSSAGTNLGNNAYSSGPIVMTATDGTNATRVWNSNGTTDLRIYKGGGSLTFTGATITKIEFNGSSLSSLSCDSYEDGTWIGSASTVTFTATATVNVKSIDVTYVCGSVVTKYCVSCNIVDGGVLSASPSSAEDGETVTLTATPDDEYLFNDDWSVKDASQNPVSVTDNKFTMPASDVTVSGSFTKKTYAITADETEHGTYTVSDKDGSPITKASKGDKILLEAFPADGYICDGWTVTETNTENTVSVSNNSFYMPAAAVTIIASFSEKPAEQQYDHAGTEVDPYSVADALKFITTLGTSLSDEDVYVKGKISSITEINTEYGNATYLIKDTDEGEALTVYRGKYLNDTSFTSNDQIAINDVVVVKGKVKYYNSTTKEFDAGNYIVSIQKAPYLKASASKTSGISADGETVTITVDTNVEGWTVQSDNVAFVVGARAGNTVPVVVSANTSTTDTRTATITVSANGVNDVLITLTQAKASTGEELASGTILWSENFAHFGTNTPSSAGTGTGTTIYAGATITYSQSSTNTKGYNEALAGGTAPELLLSKSNQTWTISGISCKGASSMSLTFKSNKTTFAVSSSSSGISISGSQNSWTITNTSADTFTLEIKNTGSSNARIDDVVLKVN